MKRNIYIAIAMIGTLSFCAFASGNSNVVAYNNLSVVGDDPILEISASQVSSFDRFEQSVYTHDKGTFTKRYETWTLTGSEAGSENLESVIDKY